MVERLRAAGSRVWLGIAIAALLLLVATDRPQGPRVSSFANVAAVGDWISRYYRQPEPQRLADAVTTLSAQGALKAPHKVQTVAAFLAGVIDADAGGVDQLLAHAARASVDQQSLLAHAVVLSARRDLLPSIAGKLPGTRATVANLLADPQAADVLRRPIGGPAALDQHWAYFFASGREEALAPIIASLGDILQETDLQGLMTGHAAKWSLTFIAGRHPRVMEICRRAAAAEAGPTAELLADVVAATEARDTRRIRREWQAAVRAWKARQEPAKELSATGTKSGA